MEYQIEVKELLIEDEKLTMTIMGTLNDERINANFVSKPKLILHFINGEEDRRIPFVLTNVIHTEGKCYFSGRYTYRLDLLFWKSGKKFLPFDMYFNFSFVDYYAEKVEATEAAAEPEEDLGFTEIPIFEDEEVALCVSCRRILPERKRRGGPWSMSRLTARRDTSFL